MSFCSSLYTELTDYDLNVHLKSLSSSLCRGFSDSVLMELPHHVLAEIDSRMPLCERVKMNKRRRSSTNEKPKYAEVSSDDDSSSVERK